MKVRKTNRILQLPFSSFSAPIVFIISSLLLVGGLAIFFEDKDTSSWIPMFIAGLSIILLMAIALEHPKIWFSDTLNLDDMIDGIKNKPQKNLLAFQDGIFSYSNDSFTIQLENESKAIPWKDISLIMAYKVDLYAIDCIVIEIHITDTCVSINDQTHGYMKFMETASNKLNNLNKDWFTAVAFPADKKIQQRCMFNQHQTKRYLIRKQPVNTN